jgi:hypothetical protein
MPAQYGNQVYQPMNQVMGQQTAQQPGFGTQVWESLFGSPQRVQQAQQYTPEAQQMMSRMMNTGFEGLKQFDFGPIRDKAIRQYQQQIVPGLSERFTSMGGRRSSGFQQALGASGSDLMSNLAALEENYNLQRQPMFQQLIGMGLRPQWENLVNPATSGLIPDLLKGLFSTGGQMAGAGGTAIIEKLAKNPAVIAKLLPLLGI